MKIKTFALFLLIFMFLAACAPAVMAAPRVDNFAFVFKDTPCGLIPLNVLDTAAGTLVHTPLDDTVSITISLRLTDSELELIYQKAMAVDFFDYPSNFIIPDDQVVGFQSTEHVYRLSMTNGEMTNSVIWTDNIMTKPGYKKADRLRELMNLINQIIRSHPEMQQLPEPESGCI